MVPGRGLDGGEAREGSLGVSDGRGDGVRRGAGDEGDGVAGEGEPEAEGDGAAAPRTGACGPEATASRSTTSAPSQESVTATAVPTAQAAVPVSSRPVINCRTSPIMPQVLANGVRFHSWRGCS